MKKIRYGIIIMSMLLCSVTSADAQVSIGIGLPHANIGINLPLFPQLVRVPGYPVYYAPQVNANYFFYDGLYWVYLDDNWYASSWYNGPWGYVAPEFMPEFVLLVPVRYYRQPPVYFRGWRSNAPPRWGKHWGRHWERRRSGWDQWNRRSVPPRAPLPAYQQQYPRDRYPQLQQQQMLHRQNYRYQSRDANVRQRIQQQKNREQAPTQRERQVKHPARYPRQQDIRRSTPNQQRGPASRENKQRPWAGQRERQVPRARGRE